MKKEIKNLGLILLVLIGCGYFAAFSELDVPAPWLRGFAVLLPVQLGALLYFAYRSYAAKIPPRG